MKKNRMMRLASILLVCVLMTTSVISGTFAKYITTDQQADTARVAKFGVVASLSGDLFGATYAAATDNTIMTYGVNDGAVSSSDGAPVVAPGTENKQGLTLKVTGTPEVSTKVILDAAEDTSAKNYVDSDIYLATGSYGVMVPYTGEVTKENVINYYTKSGNTYTKATADDYEKDVYALHDGIEVATEYHPLVWYVNGAQVTDMAAVKTALTSTFHAKEFAPNKSNDLSATVGWEWPFNDAWEDQDDNTAEKTTDADKMDTILGQMMAGVDVVAASGVNYVTVTQKTEAAGTDSANQVINVYVGDTKVACLTVAFSARLTVTQVD